MSDILAADRSEADALPVAAITPGRDERRSVGRGVLAALTAALALIAGGVALLFDLEPSLKPDPRERLGAEISIFDVEPSVTLGEWLSRTYQFKRRQEIERMTDGDGLRERGNLVYVKTTIEGFKRRSASLGWSVYLTKTRKRLPGQQFRNPESVEVRLDAPTDRSLQELWIPELPPHPSGSSFFVRVELRDDDSKVLLAVADSKALSQ